MAETETGTKETRKGSEDGRLGHATREDSRPVKLSTSDARMSFEDRMAAFRNEMYSNVLPTLPKIENYHVCWVSTTSQTDTPQWRESIGYTRITPAEAPGFDHVSVSSGPYAGNIMLNEMLAMKLPLNIYYGYMKIAHHERPMEHSNKMAAQLSGLRSNGDGVKVELADGSLSFMKASAEPRPMFTE
jgi:hypothetical protein